MPLLRRLCLLFAAVLGLGVLPAAVLPAGAAPAPQGSAFTALRGFTPGGAKVRVEPREYAASRVDLAALRAQLAPATASSPVSLAVPGPDGRLQRFQVQRTQVMESELAAAHPEIATFAGHGVDDPSLSIALDITPMGFHAAVRRPGAQGAWYVDPANDVRGTTTHLSYYGAALPAAEQRAAEGEVRAIRSTVRAKVAADRSLAGELVQRRFFRLALTSDPSYAAYFGTANVLAEKVTLINRVNQLYNDDLAINLRLVNATDAINLDTAAKATGANGPCGASACFTANQLAGCGGGSLGRNRTVLGMLVGASNYDIGHLALGVNGGGVAYLGVVGGDYKGGGCTGLPQPEGDFYAIDYVAHEMGHQFAGNHTFNGFLTNCSGGNREPTTSVEPGSGSSIMAYAGICRQDNLQPHSDPYFSQRSIDEITTYTGGPVYDNIEVQTVSLRGFDTNGEQITLDFPGSPGAITLTRGTDYNAASLKTAIQTLTGQQVSIARWGFDEFSNAVSTPSDVGFQVIFNATATVLGADATDVDLPSLTVTSPSAGVSGFVGETAQGGPSFNNGNVVEITRDHAPSVIAPADKTIPLRTPFALTATGSDVDGDALTYLWEQNDIGGATGTPLTSNTKVDGPLFRVFGIAAPVTATGTLETPSPGENTADGSPTRVFPDLTQVLADNTNAETGVCPTAPIPDTVALPPAVLDCYSEYLPTTGYVGTAGSTTPAMHFRVTARDGFLNGGGTSYDDVVLTLDPTSGPFAVTSQAGPGSSTQAGTPLALTWSVNGTAALAPNVKVTLSTDNGLHFDQVLAASTPNDGAEALVLPNTPTTQARIKIEAVDNYFFDTNDAPFTITAADVTPPETVITSGPAEGSIVLASSVKLTYTASESPASFACTLDALAIPCDGVGATLADLGGGTHVFAVAGRDSRGNVDASPATRTFTVPVDDTRLRHGGKWKVVKAASTFGGDYSTSKRKGDKLTYKVHDATRIALVVSTGKGLGPVKVYLGKKLLRTVRLQGAHHTQVVKGVVTFTTPMSGRLKIVVGKDKPVRIEGVAVVSSP